MKPGIIAVAVGGLLVAGLVAWRAGDGRSAARNPGPQPAAVPQAVPGAREEKPTRPEAAGSEAPGPAEAIRGEAVAEAARTLKGDPERQRKREAAILAFNRRTLIKAYDAVGKKDPRWDAPARKGLALTVRQFSQMGDPMPSPDEQFEAYKTAVDAGCDDPLVLYLYTRTVTARNDPGREERGRRVVRAAKALESSRYPAIRRTFALSLGGYELASKPNPSDADRKEAARMLDAAASILPEALADDPDNPRAYSTLCDTVNSLYWGRRALTNDPDAALKHVDALLKSLPGFEAIRLRDRGQRLITSAWEARGIGFAPSVSEEGWAKFHARLVEAKAALEAAWELRPDDAGSAASMLTVQKGLVGNREEMELWFDRAMKADAGDQAACWAKLDWLDPKWHGSAEDTMAFALACRDSGRWRTGIPLLLAEAHYAVSCRLPRDEVSSYFASPAVWGEIKGVFESQLGHFPTDDAVRTNYAAFCYLCGQYAEAHGQFKRLGDRLVPSQHFPEAGLKTMRQNAGARVNHSYFDSPAE